MMTSLDLDVSNVVTLTPPATATALETTEVTSGVVRTSKTTINTRRESGDADR